MDYNKVIWLLVGLLLVLLIACFAVSITTFAKHETSINVTSSNTLYEGDYFSITLVDVNGTPLANQLVYISIIDANGVENNQQLTTDESGNGMLQLNGLNPGEYTFNINYGGNNGYNACNITKKVTIQKAQLTSSDSNGQSSSQSDWIDSDGNHHYYENGQEYVGSRSGQHMTVEQAQYVAEHGMA